MTPDNREAIGALALGGGDEVRCRVDVESRRGMPEARFGEVALSGMRGEVARGVEEEEKETSSLSKVASRGVMGLGIPGI